MTNLFGRIFLLTSAILFMVLLLASGATAQKQSETNVSESSYRQARRVIDAAMAAHGGREALLSIDDYSIKFRGETVHLNQSRRADPPYDRTPVYGTLTVDYNNGGRLSHEIWQTAPGGFDGHSRFVTDSKQAANLDLLNKEWIKVDNPALSAHRNRLRWLPHYTLLDAASRGISLRFLGGGISFDNRPHDVVTYASEDGQQLTLYIDARTRLLSKFETVIFDSVVNETAAETIFTGYQTVAGKFKIPTKRILRRAKETVEEISYEFAFNQNPAAALFQIPEGFNPAPSAAPQNQPPLTKLADNVYVFRAARSYNVMFVAFRDYILVLEAPINDLTSRNVIAKIKEIIPDKPIKYVAVTHHHVDHSGGVREYVRQGANVVTTAGNRGFFSRMVEDIFSPSLSGRVPVVRRDFIETFSKKRVFSDGKQTVELYDIGAGPHAEEMTVAYLPNEKIIFQGDLLNLSDDGRVNGANATTGHFAKWLEKSKLAVEKIVAVHGSAATPDQMRQALKSAKD